MRSSLVVVFALAALCGATAASAQRTPNVRRFNPSPRVDGRGFIDVWQLRRDVAEVEAREAPDEDPHCWPEGDPEAPPPSAEEIERDAREARACEKRVRDAFAAYQRARTSFNRAWLPVMYEAIRKGDMVAEVIMRLCITTPAFDRAGVESTCDEEPRKSVATRRLKEIGFAPAVEACVADRLSSREVVDYPRAFLFSRSGHGQFRYDLVWNTDAFACLRVNRKPLTPGYLVWGRELYYGGMNGLYTGLVFRRPSSAELVAAESEIDRYLKQDPRWGLFLLHRLGRHEWVPEGMKSTTHVLDAAWEGIWVLEKETRDWTRAMAPSRGRAVIQRNGEFAQITIEAEQQDRPFLNVKGCTLRYSGGVSYLPELSSEGQQATATTLGYFYGAIADGSAGRTGTFWRDGENKEAVAPFDPKQRYKQVLMQCANAEWDDNDRLRFLLLAGDTLVEFGAEAVFGPPLSVRHYRRVK